MTFCLMLAFSCPVTAMLFSVKNLTIKDTKRIKMCSAHCPFWAIWEKHNRCISEDHYYIRMDTRIDTCPLKGHHYYISPCGETEWRGDGPDALAAELAEAKMMFQKFCYVCYQCQAMDSNNTNDGKCPKDNCDGDWDFHNLESLVDSYQCLGCDGAGRVADDKERIQVGSFSIEWAIYGNDKKTQWSLQGGAKEHTRKLHSATITAYRQNGKHWFESSEKHWFESSGKHWFESSENCFQLVQVEAPPKSAGKTYAVSWNENRNSSNWLLLRLKGKSFWQTMSKRWIHLPHKGDYNFGNTMRFLEFLRQEYELEEIEESILNGILRN